MIQDPIYQRLSKKGKRRWKIMRVIETVVIDLMLFAAGWIAANMMAGLFALLNLGGC